MELFDGARLVRLKSHLGTYLCAGDGDAVSHGYRRNPCGTVWAVEPAGDEYVRLRSHRGLYLGAANRAAAFDIATPSCRVVQGLPSMPNDSALLWTPSWDEARGCVTLSGPLGRLLRASFDETTRDFVVALDFAVELEERSWVVEAVSASELAELDIPFAAFARFHSAEEPLLVEDPLRLRMPVPRIIFYNTVREDGVLDEYDDGTWRHFTFGEQSLAALRRRLQEETKHKDFVICCRSICHRSDEVPRLCPVVLDLPPGNNDMEFILVLVPSKVADQLQWPEGYGPAHYKKDGE